MNSYEHEPDRKKRKMDTQPKNSFVELPTDTYYHIFSFLDTKSLFSTAPLVSRTQNSIIKQVVIPF
jgi:hypothetical protein